MLSVAWGIFNDKYKTLHKYRHIPKAEKLIYLLYSFKASTLPTPTLDQDDITLGSEYCVLRDGAGVPARMQPPCLFRT